MKIVRELMEKMPRTWMGKCSVMNGEAERIRLGQR